VFRRRFWLGRRPIRYWRSKHGNEVDFVFVGRGQPPAIIECKWSADAFDPAGVRVFRRRYPRGRTFVVVNDIGRSFTGRSGDVEARFVSLEGLIAELGTR
jgi:hypothetical protein